MLYRLFTLQGLHCNKICNFFKVNVLNLAEIPLEESMHNYPIMRSMSKENVDIINNLSQYVDFHMRKQFYYTLIYP